MDTPLHTAVVLSIAESGAANAKSLYFQYILLSRPLGNIFPSHIYPPSILRYQPRTKPWRIKIKYQKILIDGFLMAALVA